MLAWIRGLLVLVCLAMVASPVSATEAALQSAINVSDAIEASVPNRAGYAAVGFDGTNIWIARWAGNEIVVLTPAGVFVETFTIPGLSGIRGMTWDGSHLWVATNSTTLSRIDPVSRTVVQTLGVPLAARYVSYDASANGGAGGFWIGNFSTDILLVDMTAQVLATLPAAAIGLTSRYGLALDTTSEAEPFLWVFDQGPGGNAARLHIIDLPEGTVRPQSQDLGAFAPEQTGHLAGGAFLSNGLQPGMPDLLALSQSSPDNVLFVLDPVATPEFTIGGSVNGLLGDGLVLQNNGGDDLPIAADGSFAFATPLIDGSDYAVTVLTQPASPLQTCTVTDGTGTVAAAAVTSVQVTCTTEAFAIGGTVSGLAAGNTLVLQNNLGDDLIVGANGAFEFLTPVADGSDYAVTVLTQPTTPNQTCAVTSAAGTVDGAAVATVAVDCTTNTYFVGGFVTGLAAGNMLVLQNDGGDDLPVMADGPFAFATPVLDGSGYQVTVSVQPSDQVGVVSAGSGVVNGADVTGVMVNVLPPTILRDGFE